MIKIFSISTKWMMVRWAKLWGFFGYTVNPPRTSLLPGLAFRSPLLVELVSQQRPWCALYRHLLLIVHVLQRRLWRAPSQDSPGAVVAT